jgi:hypothetical protein
MKAMAVGLLVASGLAGGAAVGVAAQSPITRPPSDDARPPIRPALRSGEYHVIVEGCAQGTRLKRLGGVRDMAGEYLGVTEWVLEGPREMMQQLRSGLDGFHIEVTGIARVPPSAEPSDTEVDARRLPDGTRISVGARRSNTERSQTGPDRGTARARLEVESIRVLAERAC